MVERIVPIAAIVVFIMVVAWGLIRLIGRKGRPSRYEMYDEHEKEIAQGDYGWAES